MAISTETVARRYIDVAANVDISVDIPAFEAQDVYVYYGNAALVAAQGTDYSLTLAEDFETFTVTPLQPLIDKIDALIAADSEETNYITVRRTLNYETEATPDAVRYTPFTSSELDRNAMRDQQLAELMNRALVLAPNFVGDEPKLELNSVVPGRALVVTEDGTAIEPGPSAEDIQDAQANAEEAAVSASTAASSASAAASSASAAASSAATASSSATDAATSATDAATSATDAADAAADAATDAAEAAVDAVWKEQKHLLSADWQPRPSSFGTGEEARFQAFLDSIAARHPDLSHGHLLGDLIYEGSQNNTGAAPEYGYLEFLADFRQRLPIPEGNMFFIPGNHDRDGTGAGQHEKAWSMQSYRSYIGPEYYYTVQGNLLNIYMGDMGGSTGGAITDAVVEWFEQVLKRNKDKNIFVNIHHPFAGTYNANPDNDIGSQYGSTRFTDILTEVSNDADNVVAVFFGHVGSGDQFSDETAFGTRHIQIGTHIPGNVDNGRNDQYYVMNLTHEQSDFTIEQWDATTDTLLSTKTIDWKYPVELGPRFTFDGRHQEDKIAPKVEAVHVNLPLDEYREYDGSSWVVTNNPIPVAKFGATDRAYDGVPESTFIAIRWDWPGVTGGDDASAIDGYLEGAAWTGIERLGGSQDDPELALKVRLYDGSSMVNSYFATGTGLHVGHDTTTSNNPGNNAHVGATLNSAGYVSTYRSGGIAAYFGRPETGVLVEFNNGSTRAGSIDITGANSVSYLTSSDERLKTDFESFDGLEMVKEINTYRFSWIADGLTGYGVKAQELYETFPTSVTVGDETGEPWQVDYSKLVPVLLDAVKRLEAKVAALEEQLEDI